MAGRYLATELQDDNGDVIYPHTEADIVFASDGTTVEENLGGDVTDSEIQEIFSDSDSQLESGKKLSVKEKIKKALKRYQTLLGMRILDTVEEVEANTDDGYLMGAKAGAALINDLAQQPEWIRDATGKITGYKTQQGGADTVFPFSGKPDNYSTSLTCIIEAGGGKHTVKCNVSVTDGVLNIGWSHNGYVEGTGQGSVYFNTTPLTKNLYS